LDTPIINKNKEKGLNYLYTHWTNKLGKVKHIIAWLC